MKYQGSCHCKNISFEVEAEFKECMECNCSICTRKAYLLAIVPHSAMTITKPREGMSTYTFNKHNIQHHFCPKCGCAPYGEGSDGEGNVMVAINLRCIHGLDLETVKINPVDGKSL